MPSAFLVRLRLTGPVRFGPVSGARHETERIGHSDTLYRALSSALRQLGEFDPWEEATAASSAPPVTVSSLFPFAGRTLYVPAPQSIWPPAASSRTRWKTASLVPANIVSDLLAGKALHEERWEIDPASQCVIAAGGSPPFRIAYRNAAAVDRLNPGTVKSHATACLEFASNAGLWSVVSFATEEDRQAWENPVKSAFRYLSDTGIGGERSQGWGRVESLEFQSGEFPKIILPQFEPGEGELVSGHWLLSVYSPSEQDNVNWSAGHYQLLTRAGIHQNHLKMAAEGSVLAATSSPTGRALNVSTSANPAYRAGFACSVPLPYPRNAEVVVP